MSIIESQIKKLINTASIESLKDGRVLDISLISKLIGEKVRLLNGGPTLKVIRQDDRSKFNIAAYNKMMDDIKFDLEILYDTIVSKTQEVFKHYNSIQASYKSQKSQLNYIGGLVDDILFSYNNTDDYFYGVNDNLSSLDKVDLTESSSDVIDLEEGVALLPFNTPSSIRLKMDHLITRPDGNVSVSSFDNSKTEGKNGSLTIFGYAFTDISSIWRYEISSASKDGVRMLVTFPVMPDESTSRITRIEFSSIAGSNIRVTPLTSLDNLNYIRPPNSKEKSFTKDVTKLSWDFAEIPVRYIRFQIDKLLPDYGNEPRNNTISNPVLGSQSSPQQPRPNAFNISSQKLDWVYVINISNISIYKLGRSLDSVLVTKPIAPIDKPVDSISRIALQVDEELLPETAIDYYIALCDSSGTITGDYKQINPINRVDTNIPKQINFGSSLLDTIDITGDYKYLNYVTSKNVNYYQLYQLDTSNTYRFGGSKLYRGGNLFSRVTNKAETTKQIQDNYISFVDGNRTKQLYSAITETAQVLNRLIGQGNIAKSFLKLSHTIVTSPKITRNATDPELSIDPEPDYAISKVEHLRPIMRITRQSLVPTGTPITVNGVTIPVAATWLGTSGGVGSIGVPILLNGQPIDIIPSGTNAPVLKFIGSNNFVYIFVEGIDYSLKRSDDPYFNNFSGWNAFPLHWRIVPIEPTQINVLSGSPLTGTFGGTGSFYLTGGNLPPVTFGPYNLTSSQELFLDYYIDPDITRRVVSISYSDNEIELDGLLQLVPGDSVLITYRAVPENIIPNSIRVTSGIGENEGTVYQSGIDYTISNGSITKLLGGSISDIVYVDFKYKEPTEETETFSVWCYYDNKEPFKFVYNELSLRISAGERFLWSYEDGGANNVKDITTQSFITLTKGWHLFTVKSLNPDIFNDAAIIKVLKFRSIDNYYLFQRKDWGGRLFSKVTAYRSPLRQVTYSVLKNATLKTDHSVFAIDNSKIYVNFKPADTTDLYPYRVDSSGSLILQDYEEFIFTGLRKYISEETDYGYLKLKVILSRNKNSNGGITPKLSSYNIRIEY